MFSITPYAALRQIHTTKGEMKWTPCKVLGVHMDDGEPRYIVEVAEAGKFYMMTVDTIRKCP